MIYFDNAEVNMPHTHWRIRLLPNNIWGGSRAGQVTLYTTDCTGLFTALV